MVSNPGVAARCSIHLRNASVPVKMVSTSEIKVSVVIPESDMDKRSGCAYMKQYELDNAINEKEMRSILGKHLLSDLKLLFLNPISHEIESVLIFVDFASP